MNKIINRYIFRELLSPFAGSLFFLTFVFLMTRIPEITNMVVNYNAGILSVGLLVVYTLPRFLEFTVPMSVMIAILLTFMRMTRENEIVALKGAGISLYRLLPVVLVFCLAGFLLTLWVTVFGVSWGKLSLKKKSIEMARTSIDAALQERQFNMELEDVMIYVSHVDMRTKALTDVFIEDRRTKGMVSISIAPSGELIRLDDEQVYTIRLHNGVINQVDMEKQSVSHIQFGNYDINIDLNLMNRTKGHVSKALDERSLVELLGVIRSGVTDKIQLNSALMQLHERLSIPFACLALGIFAFPLGVQSTALRRSSGFGMGIFFFLVYYFLLAIGWSAGETGKYPPVLGMWLPNLVMGGVGVFFLVRNAGEKPVLLPGFIGKAGRAVQNLLKRNV
jgi:lipopolysaccharide export system permease protein